MCANIVSLVYNFKVYAMHWDKASIASKIIISFSFYFSAIVFFNEIQQRYSTFMQLIKIKQKQRKWVYKTILLLESW